MPRGRYAFIWWLNLRAVVGSPCVEEQLQAPMQAYELLQAQELLQAPKSPL